MPRADVTQMPFAKLYPLLVNKAEKKGHRRWLTPDPSTPGPKCP